MAPEAEVSLTFHNVTLLVLRGREVLKGKKGGKNQKRALERNDSDNNH